MDVLKVVVRVRRIEIVKETDFCSVSIRETSSRRVFRFSGNRGDFDAAYSGRWR